MTPRAWALSGLASGAIAGAAILVAAVALAPDPRTASRGGPPLPSAPPSSAASTVPTSSGTPAPTTGAGSPSASAVASGSPSTVLHVGEPAPVLAVPQVGGGFIDLATLRGQPVWVVFMSTTCSGCEADLNRMTGFRDRYEGDGLVVLAIAVEESESTVATFARRAGLTFPFGLDVNGGAKAEWEVINLPTHFWIGRDGIIRDAAPTSIDAAAMASALAQILPGVSVTP